MLDLQLHQLIVHEKLNHLDYLNKTWSSVSNSSNCKLSLHTKFQTWYTLPFGEFWIYLLLFLVVDVILIKSKVNLFSLAWNLTNLMLYSYNPSCFNSKQRLLACEMVLGSIWITNRIFAKIGNTKICQTSSSDQNWLNLELAIFLNAAKELFSPLLSKLNSRQGLMVCKNNRASFEAN